MKGVIQKSTLREYFQGGKNCLTFIGMYQPALCPKLQCPFLSLVCKSGHQKKKKLQ